MTPRTKVRYEIDLATPVPNRDVEGAVVRSITNRDLEDLASLMLDAYRGTIDYEGEELDDALDEVRGYLHEEPLLQHAYVAEVDGEAASAVLVSLLDGEPFIRAIMTHPAHKGSGLARLVTTSAMASLSDGGYRSIVLFITVGNEPSEALFRSVGAVPTA